MIFLMADQSFPVDQGSPFNPDVKNRPKIYKPVISLRLDYLSHFQDYDFNYFELMPNYYTRFRHAELYPVPSLRPRH